MTLNMIDTFRRWLPHPVYRFVGGPFDGKDSSVTLYEAANGMIPPDVWRLYDPPKPPPADWRMPIMEMDDVATVHSYRFIPRPGRINEGHYEWIEPA